MAKKKVEVVSKEEVKMALSQHDLYEAKRKQALELLTENLPYNKDLYIGQVHIILKRTIEDVLLTGKMLLAIKENEPHGTFQKVVEEEIGLPYRTAKTFMNAAIKTEQFPQIDFKQFDKVSHVYALLEAPDEDLKELEEKGIMAGQNVDELNKLSVKDMRALIKELKTETDKIVKEEVKALETERDALINEVDRLKKYEPTETLPDAHKDRLKIIEKHRNDFVFEVRRFMDDGSLDEYEDFFLVTELSAQINFMTTAMEELRFEFSRQTSKPEVFDPEA